ncbi:MAG: cell wall-binding repeat-containing protein [Buchananella hordeovulneris]|nr:cell wall-binding repeat-containing protein [Buchananella hordeovulneris]
MRAISTAILAVSLCFGTAALAAAAEDPGATAAADSSITAPATPAPDAESEEEPGQSQTVEATAQPTPADEDGAEPTPEGSEVGGDQVTTPTLASTQSATPAPSDNNGSADTSAPAPASPAPLQAPVAAPATRLPATIRGLEKYGVRRVHAASPSATRLALLAELFPQGADTVILTPREDTAALAEAAALAGQVKAALLPVGSQLTAEDEAALRKLAPKAVLNLGAAAAAATQTATVTGAKVSNVGHQEILALLPQATHVVAVDARKIDYGAAIPFAAAQNAILLARPLAAQTQGDLAARGITRVTLVGGAGSLEGQLRAALPAASFSALSGGDRFDTAARVASAGWKNSSRAVLIRNTEAATYSTAAYLAALNGAPMLHTTDTCVPSRTADFLHSAGVSSRVLFGTLEETKTPAASLPCGVLTSMPSKRYQGKDATVTSIALSNGAYKGNVEAVVLVGRPGIADGPAAAPLAARLGGPVLITGQAAMSSELKAELRRLAPRRIVILGGENAVSSRVAREATTFAPVDRIAGTSRQATAEAIAARFGAAQTAYVVGASAMPDAIPAAVAAARVDAPVLLATADTTALVNQLQRLGVKEVVVVGGGNVVSSQTIYRIKAATGAKVSRLSGADRYATARAVASTVPGADRYALVGGQAQIDALAVSPISAQLSLPVLYAHPHCQTADHLNFVRGRAYTSRIVVGGANSVSSPAANYVCGSLAGVADNITTCEPHLAGFRATLPGHIRPWCPPRGLLAPTTRITAIGGGQNLLPGWNGTKVSLVQHALGLGSRWETMDGTTIAAVRNFQSRRGLPVTGVVDQRTWNALGTGYGFNIDAWQTKPRLGARATRSQRIETMIAFAMEQRGSEYTWGGAGPYQLGYDCSGLVLQALYAAGLDPQPINVMAHQWPEYRTSRELGHHPRMQRLPFSERQRGDLIFYHNGQGVIDHVTIYLGNEMMIEAGGIALNTHVTSLRWGNYYPTIVRPFP